MLVILLFCHGSLGARQLARNKPTTTASAGGAQVDSHNEAYMTRYGWTNLVFADVADKE